MTTVEKLLVQIFERKNSIIEQVKQQKELYSQHLASKLIIDGIAPPSWLWNPNTSSDSNGGSIEPPTPYLPSPLVSSHFSMVKSMRDVSLRYSVGTSARRETRVFMSCGKRLIDFVLTSKIRPSQGISRRKLNKEELISELLRQDPQPLTRCSVAHYHLYDNLVGRGDNEEVSDGVFMQNQDFKKQDHPKVQPLSSVDRAGCVLNYIPDPDLCVTSPDDQTDERVVNIYNAPDQSLAVIQRSMSQQKALQLQDSKRQDHTTVQPLSSEDQAVCALDCTLDQDFSVTSPEDQTDKRIVNIYNAPDLSLAVIQRSKSRQKALQLRNSATALDKTGLKNENTRDVFSSQIRFSLSAIKQAGQSDELLNLAELCEAGIWSCADWDDKAGSQSKENEKDVYSGRITRSRSYSKVPDFVRCSFTLDCTSETCRDNSFSHTSKVRGTKSMHISDSEQADNYVNTLPKSTGPSVLCQICGDTKVDGADCLSNDKDTNVFAGRISRSNISGKYQSCGRDSSKADISSDDYQRIYIVKDYRDDLPPNPVYGSPINPSNVLNEDCNTQESLPGDCQSHRGRDDVPSCSFNRQNVYADGISDLEILSQSAKADAGILDPSSGNTTKVNDSKEIHGLVKPSVGVTRSLTLSIDRQLCVPVAYNEIYNSKGTMSKLELTQMSAANEEIQNTSIGQFGPSCYGTHDMLDEHENASLFNVEKLVLRGHVDQSGSSSSKQRRELEFEVAPTASDSFVPVEPKQLSSNGFEECDLRAFTMNSGKRSLDNSLEKIRRPFPVSQDKETSVGVDQLSSGKQSSGILDISSEGEAVQRDFFESDIQETPENRAEKGPVIIGIVLNDFENKTEVRPNTKISEVFCEADSILSETVDTPHIQIHPTKLYLEDEHEALPKQHMEEVQNLGRIYTDMESWPQPKRRKIEHQQTHSLTTSPSFRVRNPHSPERGPARIYLKNMEINAVVDTFHVDIKHTDIQIPPEIISNLVEGYESTFSCQNGEVGFFYKEKNEYRSSSPVINNGQLGTALVPSLKKESVNSLGRFIEEKSDTNSSSNHFDARELVDGQHSQDLHNLPKDTDYLSSVNLPPTNIVLEGIQSPKLVNGSQAQNSVLSLRTEDMELIGADQSMPVLEGFIVDEQEDSGEMDFAADRCVFDKLKLPSNTIERASIIAEICRSASLNKRSSHFSSAFEFQGNQKFCQSVPNGHLECLDFASSFSSNSDVGEKLHSGRSSVDDRKKSLEGMTYSDCLAYSGARYGWNSRNQHVSPVGKLWERLSSHTGSSEKHSSSNPELTCFPIEEDASISEDSKTVDENAGDAHEEVDSSLARQCDKRQPFKDLSNLGLNPSMSVSVYEKTLIADIVDFVGTKLSVTGTQDKFQSGPENQYRNKSEMCEKQTLFIGVNDGRKNQTSLQGSMVIKKANESINDGISKSLLSINTGLKRQDQKLSLKGSRRNNIISNVSSFIPLVQQKPAATVCAGKRDVKVKALETAEAAKRLEEKKENERKMRKEALKLEREKKNLRQMELEKIKKEEGRKKKNADNIARKRQRVEEEKKEKDKKRMRLDARYQKREQEEKMSAAKAAKDEQVNSKKDFFNESKKQHSREIVKGDDIALKREDNKFNTTGVVMNYEECGTSRQSCEVGKATHAVNRSPPKEDLIVCNSQGKSYEISPYQCSDDEDEVDDELPTKKYIPTWASKSSVALLFPLQQEMDPNSLFPPESFCSIDEALLPRKLQQKQVAA
ncbi:hypothetical protein OROGR_015056 [Orobanche gracilis]